MSVEFLVVLDFLALTDLPQRLDITRVTHW